MVANRLIKLKEVTKLTSLSLSTIYDKISKNKFPPQITLGGKSVAWLEAEVDNWISEQVANSRDNNNYV